ncbi:class I SAM-dependent methyltransferase [Pseudonocardia benzenivorans]
MIEHARRLHPECTFGVGSATDLDLAEASWGGLLGWWSLFNLPRDVLPQVLSAFARALVPGGQLIVATHVGDGDVQRTEAYGGVAVRWTTHLWQPDQLLALIEQTGLTPKAELRLPAEGRSVRGSSWSPKPDEHPKVPSVVVEPASLGTRMAAMDPPLVGVNASAPTGGNALSFRQACRGRVHKPSGVGR